MNRYDADYLFYNLGSYVLDIYPLSFMVEVTQLKCNDLQTTELHELPDWIFASEMIWIDSQKATLHDRLVKGDNVRRLLQMRTLQAA